MGIFARFVNAEGKTCIVYDSMGGARPPTVEALLNFQDCGREDLEDEEDESPHGAAGGAMEAIRYDERVYVKDDRGVLHEVTGGELAKRAAADTLDRLTRQEMARHPGLTYPAAFERVRKVNGELVRAYTGQAMSVEDHLKRVGPSAAYAVIDGTATYRISGPRPDSPLLRELEKRRQLEETVTAEIHALQKLTGGNFYDAMRRVLGDDRYKDLDPEIRQKIEDFWTPPTLK